MSSSDSEYEPSSEPVSSPSIHNEADGVSLKEVNVFSGVFEDDEQSDTDSVDSQLEEMEPGVSSLSDGDDLEDPEWLPEKGNRKGTDKSQSKPSKLDSEFEMFRRIEYELFQEEPSCSSHIEEQFKGRLDDLTCSQALYDDANDSDSEGDMCVGEIAEQATKFFSELHQTAKSQRKILKGFEGNFINRKAQRLPSHLEPVMGSANLAIAQKKYTDAIELCNEVIRQAPCCPAPYINLALTYKELEDMDRYFQFTLLALHINSFDRTHPRPEDADSWEQLGIIAKQRGDLHMAIECIKKSLRAVPRRSEALWLLGEIRLEMKEYRAALTAYNRLEKVVQETAIPIELCEIARRKALILYESGSVEQAREAIYQHLIKGWQIQHVIELLNLLLELHLLDKEYTAALKTTVILLCCRDSQQLTEVNPNVVVVEELSVEVMSIPNEGVISEETRPADKNDNKESKLELFDRYFWSEVTRESGFEVEGEGGFLVAVEGKQLLVPEQAFAPLPLDLQAKLVIPSIHTSNLELAHHLITHALKSLPIAGYGEIWLDVSEALLECSQFDLSVDLLRTVLKCHAYDEPGVWLMLGRSLEEVSYQEEVWDDWNDKPILEEAIVLYRKVIDTIPDNVDSKLRLAGIYQKKGMKEEAIALLAGSQDGTDNFLSNKDISYLKSPPDIRVVYRRAILHMENGQSEECLNGFLILLDYFCREVYLLKSFHLMVMPFLTPGSRILERYNKRDLVYSRYQHEEQGQDQYLTMAQWYRMLKRTCDMLSALGKREELFKLIVAVNILKKFRDTEFLFDVHLLSVSVCIRQRSFYYAYRFSRRLIPLISKSNVFAMLFNCLTENSYLSRNLSLKVLKRIWLQDPTNYRIVLNFALNLHSIGSFHLSLLLLHSAYKLRPDNYRLLFFMTMTYIRIAHNRTHASKNALISQAFAFAFKYKEKMGDCAEVFYNLGRAFHAIGYKHWACDYYQRVLSLDVSYHVRTGQYCDAGLVELSSLKREAAFNLSLIYEESGSRELARATLQSHCVV